jgi:hypothetical protein
MENTRKSLSKFDQVGISADLKENLVVLVNSETYNSTILIEDFLYLNNF